MVVRTWATFGDQYLGDLRRAADARDPRKASRAIESLAIQLMKAAESLQKASGRKASKKVVVEVP